MDNSPPNPLFVVILGDGSIIETTPSLTKAHLAADGTKDAIVWVYQMIPDLCEIQEKARRWDLEHPGEKLDTKEK